MRTERATGNCLGRTKVSHICVWAQNDRRDGSQTAEVFRKPLNDAPPKLQKILLKLTKYDLDVRYIPRKQHVISDCLSRAPPSELNQPLSLKMS